MLKWRSWHEVLKQRVSEYEDILMKKALGEELNLFIPTGLRAWDANGGLRRRILHVLGGVDGQGKSILKSHLRTAAAMKGYKVAQIDFEDPEEFTADRDFATLTHINSRSLGLGNFGTKEYDQLLAAYKATDWAQNVTFHGGLVDADEIMESLTALAGSDATRPDLVLVDYAQALPSDGNEGLERKIARLAWDLNVFAQRFNCAVVVFSQVKPEVANRGQAAFWAGKKRDPESWDVSGFCPGPGTQDLAWSSAFGQRARAVGYIFRPGDYERKMGKPDARDDRLWIRWAKVTFGASGMMEFGFDAPSARIYDV